MAEYIEREKVYETLKAALDEIDNLSGLFSQDYIRGCRNTLGIVINDMQKIPTADIRPERHGQWIDIDKQNVWGDDEPVNLFRCSACKISTETRKDHIDRYHFCPNCGAKMDGKDSNK